MSAIAQLPDYHLQIFDYTYGIRPGNIVDLAKDTQGFLWVLYPRSIQRFDGREVREYSVQGYLEHILCDSEGRTWVTSSENVYLFDKEYDKFYDIPLHLKNKPEAIGPVFTMPEGRIWLITSQAFLEYQEEQKQFQQILEELPVPPGYNTRAFGYYGHTLFFGHTGFVYRYDVRSGRLDSLPDHNMRRIFPLSTDSVLITTWSLDSYWYNFATDTITNAVIPPEFRAPFSSTFSVRSMVEVHPGKYLIASREGIFKYDNHNKEFRNLQFYYKGSPIVTKDFTNNIIYDSDGYIWMAAVEGIARFALRGQSFGLMRIRQMDEQIPMGIDNIRSIAEDEKGNLWLATGNGFVCWERDKNRTKLYLADEQSTDKLAYPSVRGIVYDGKYLILGPADLGIWLFDPETESYRRPHYASPEVEQFSSRDFIDAITSLQNGDHMVLGRDAIYILDGKTYTLRILDVPAGKENSNYAYQGHKGEIWVTTMEGMHLLDSNLNYLQKVDLLTEARFITSGTFLPDGRLLFSTQDGLFIGSYDNGQVAIGKFTDLFDNIFIATLYYDANGIIWATSEDGIYRFDPAQSRLNLYDYSDNIQGYGFNGNSYLKSSDGILFFGGINGLNYLIPENFAASDDSLQVFIQSVKSGMMDSVSYPLNKRAELKYMQRSLEVEFVCPYFNNPDKVKYRYRVAGLDNQWNYVGSNNRVRFTSLPSGDYNLHLEASVNQADWFPAKNTFSFRVNPPFWLTWWFILITVACIAVALWLFIRNRNKRIREQQEELETEQVINYFSTRMADRQSVEDLLWDVAKNCIGRLQFEHCAIYLLDKTNTVLRQMAIDGPQTQRLSGHGIPIEFPVSKGICGAVALTGKPEIVHDTAQDPRYIIDGVPRASEITVPMISGGRILGVINCEHSRKRFFTQHHLSILSTIASLCAARIIKAQAEAEKSETEKILMETKQQMADVEMQALRAQMNPHFIFNCLNSINRYIVKSDQATASLYLTRFAKLIRLILDNSNSKTVTLTNELEALRLYIEMETIRFEKQFSYTITIDEEVHPDHVYVPPLIIQPYVENAIWHGLLHKETAGHLFIHITRKTKTLLECIIEDDGVGREKSKELRSKTASPTKSLGMKLTENRLALLNKYAEWEAAVEITDLKDDAGEAAGTRVVLKIPVDG